MTRNSQQPCLLVDSRVWCKEILVYLEITDQLNMAQICKQFSKMIKSPLFMKAVLDSRQRFTCIHKSLTEKKSTKAITSPQKSEVFTADSAQ